MPYAMPNNTYTHIPIPPLESLYVLFSMALSAVNPSECARFQEFVRQSPEFRERYAQTFPFSDPTQAGSSAVDEAVEKQKWIDKAFEYVAPSLFVTSVLASGELVGSTIWGISKYVSKDIIYNTLGATTAAVILHSAELLGYRNEVQEFFGIKPAEKRATVAIKMGSKLGQGMGAVAGTSLTLLAEPWLLPVAPVLAPYLPLAGLFIGGVAGEVIGAGLGAGLNNLLLSTIGILPASYKGIKQKGGKFAERIKNSSEVKRKAKEAKAETKSKKEDDKNAGPVKEQGVGARKVPSTQPLLEEDNHVVLSQPNSNTSLVPAAHTKVPFVQGKSGSSNRQEGKGILTPLVIGQQGNNEQNVVVPPVHAITGEGGNKTVVENPGVQHDGEQNNKKQQGHKKHPEQKLSGNTLQKKDPESESSKLSSPKSNKVVQGEVLISPNTTPTKPFNKVIRQEISNAGGDVEEGFVKVVSKHTQRKIRKNEAQSKKQNQIDAQQKKKFTSTTQSKNALQNALTQGEQNKGQLYAEKSRNRSDQNSQSSGTGRNK